MKAVQLQAGAPAEGQVGKFFFLNLNEDIAKIVIKGDI
jgi:hypothetical protein